MEILLRDLRYAFRLLRKAPAFTAIVIVTVALGVGANVSVFTVVYAALLKGLPYPDADRVVFASDMAPGLFLDWRGEASSFSSMSALRTEAFDVAGVDRPERIDGAVVTASFFDVMGVPAARGRALVAADDVRGERVVVIADRYWRQRFGADPRAVGSSVSLNGQAYTVVGVMPAGFEFPDRTEIWAPPRHVVPGHPLRPEEDATQQRGSHYLGAYARLKPGVTLHAAQAEQRVIFERLLKRFPKDMVEDDVDVPLVPLREWLVGDIKPALVMLFAAVGLVLLIGCANVANLMLARATARGPEISVRAALGAGHMRIVRQLLTESVVLALVGGAAGLLIASWAVPLLVSLSPASVRDVRATVGMPVFLFALAVSLLTGVVFGCVPAIQAGREGVANALKGSGRATEGRHGRRFRQFLIVLECAFSVALLVIAGLLIRSFVSLRQVDPGFRPGGLQTARIVLPATRYPKPEQQAQFFDRAIERLRAHPETAQVALAARLPFAGGNSTRGLVLDHSGIEKNPVAGIRVVSPAYFGVIGQAIRRGRDFTAQDTASAPLVAVVNESMARRDWPGQDPIGHHFTIGGATRAIEIVGVVADVKHDSLRDQTMPEFYQPYAQAPWSFMTLVVRTPLSVQAFGATLAHELAGIDGALPPPAVSPMTALIVNSFAMDRFEMVGLGLFAAVALTLAMIGLYGVMSYLVSRRTREMGLRIALGASQSEILRLVMIDGVRLTGTGMLIGLVMAAVAGRVIRGWLFGVEPADPVTFVAVTAIIGVVAVVASYLPARRAMAVDPMVAVRTD